MMMTYRVMHHNHDHDDMMGQAYMAFEENTESEEPAMDVITSLHFPPLLMGSLLLAIIAYVTTVWYFRSLKAERRQSRWERARSLSGGASTNMGMGGGMSAAGASAAAAAAASVSGIRQHQPFQFASYQHAES